MPGRETVSVTALEYCHARTWLGEDRDDLVQHYVRTATGETHPHLAAQTQQRKKQRS